MATDHNNLHELIDKLHALPEERISEVEDFIDFLRQRETDRQLTRAAKKTSEPVFSKAWDNPDDAAYDSL